MTDAFLLMIKMSLETFVLVMQTWKLCMAHVYISDFEVPNLQVLIPIFFLVATWKLNMAHVYISDLEVLNLKVLISLFV